MAFDIDQIRSAAQRVATSHGLDVVDIEFQGGAKHRLLRIFIEKNAAERARLAEKLASGDPTGPDSEESLPANLNPAHLAGITHDDCHVFSTDFGTLLDVEDLMPGTAEYTLEVSSPGLDRRLTSREDFERFLGSLVKIRTFEPVNGNRHWQGRLKAIEGSSLNLDLSEVKQGRGKQKKAVEVAVQIDLANVEKANLVPEF
ncbi:MAG: ribosome maturation factor RimP [Acidobacteriaceae bacterium]